MSSDKLPPRVKKRVLERVLHIIWSETLGRRLASTKSLAKSLAESVTKSLVETLSEILGETFGETLGESPQSFESDYMHGSPQDSLRDSFFYAGLHSFLNYSHRYRLQWLVKKNSTQIYVTASNSFVFDL